MMAASPTMRRALRILRDSGGRMANPDFVADVPEHQTRAALVRCGAVEVLPPWSIRRRFRQKVAEVVLTDRGAHSLRTMEKENQ